MQVTTQSTFLVTTLTMKRSHTDSGARTPPEPEVLKKPYKLKKSDTVDVAEIDLQTGNDESAKNVGGTLSERLEVYPVETYKTVGCGLHVGMFLNSLLTQVQSTTQLGTCSLKKKGM